MEEKKQSFLSCIVAAAIMVASLAPPFVHIVSAEDQPQIYDASQASPLLVTEVVTDGPASSRFTYTEVYNNSDAAINFKNYHFYYTYPNGTYLDFTTGGKDVMIASGKTLILWQSDLKAKSGQGNSVADFNNYYGTHLVENTDIVRINYSGIHATAKRGYRIGQDLDSIVTEAWSNEHSDDIPANNPDKLAIQYKYPTNGIISSKQGVSAATPGSVDPSQVPATRVHISASAPVIKNVTATGGSALTVNASIEYDGAAGAMPVSLFYRQKKSDGSWQSTYDKIAMTRQSDGTFAATVGSGAIFGEQASWYVKADCDPSQTAQSDEQTTDLAPAVPAADKTAPLAVTEVAANPESTDGGQYSYFEVYNQTDKPVNLSYYNIYYYYDYPAQTAAADGKVWSIGDFTSYVQPGQAMVFWLSSNGTTVDQFNSFYGTNLVLGQNIVQVNYAGLHSSDPRWIRFGTSEDSAFTVAAFNLTPDQLTHSKTALQYACPHGDGSADESIPVEVDAATPGTAAPWQVPAALSASQGYPNYPADDGQKPTLKVNQTEGLTVPESINEGDELKVMYDTDLLLGATSAERVAAFDDSKAISEYPGNEPGGSQRLKDRPYLIGNEILYKLDGNQDWTVIQQKTQWRLGHFLMQIPSDILFGHSSVTFKVRAYTLYGMSETEESTVKINRLNDTGGKVRLNVQDGQILSKTTTVTANDGSGNQSTKIQVDGKDADLTPVLEDGAYFSFQTSGLNNYFKNAITAPYGGNSRDIITILSPWCELPTSRAVHIDNKYFTYNAATNSYDVTLTMWAGDSGTPFEEIYDVVKDENHEDYNVSNVQLRLANGKNYLPTQIAPDNAKTNTDTALQTSHTIGDSAGMVPHMDVTFSIPAADATAVGAALDTTALSEGEHTITATSGSEATTAKVKVDNTAPAVDLGIAADSTQYQPFTLEAGSLATDANGVQTVAASLDGEVLSLPATVTPRELAAGKHTLKVVAADAAGNTTTKEISFQTEKTDPAVSDSNNDGITSDSANLSVSLADGSTSANVSFLQGKTIDAKDITSVSGNDGSGTATQDGLPYRLYTVKTGTTADTDTVTVKWGGSASNEDDTHILGLYAYNNNTKSWDLAGKKAKSDETIQASFAAKNHVSDGAATLLVQCLPAGTVPDLSPTEASAGAKTDTAASQWDGTSVPANYDFSFAWETDTQYYSESFPYHYENMNKWIVDNRDKLDIRYVFHTGDLVDDVDMTGEWNNADKAMKIFDDNNMPYGVLGGNHDVYAGAEGYGNYWKYFGQDRFQNKSYYGGTYKNNLGHYDLLTEDGQDFIILYMSWDIYQNEIDWMNQVLQQYKDRKAIIALHRYSNVSISNDSILDYTGKLVQDQVVKKNPNVFAVLNGHYHGASIQTDSFDDNGDGSPDRNVYQICTDYQSDPEGGSEYVKFLYFDLKNNKVYVNSYSPYRKDFNYFDTQRLSSYGPGTKAVDMDIAELDVPFNSAAQSLTASSVDAQVLSQNAIGNVENVKGNASYQWQGLTPETSYSWYAHITNDKGGVTDTSVKSFTTEKAPVVPTTYKVTATAGEGGTISNTGETEVAKGGDLDFTLTPDAGWKVSSVLLDGKSVTWTGNTYTLKNVMADHTVAVSFEQIPGGGEAGNTETLPSDDGFVQVELPQEIGADSVRDSILTSENDNGHYADILDALRAEGYTGLAVHDVQLLDADNKPITDLGSRTATVKIKIPDNASGDLKVFWYNPKDGTLTDMQAQQEDGYLVFTTNHFSDYVVARAADTGSGSVSSSDPVSSTPSGSTETAASNPDTGVASAVPAFVLFLGAAACAVLTFGRRRRNRND